MPHFLLIDRETGSVSPNTSSDPDIKKYQESTPTLAFVIEDGVEVFTVVQGEFAPSLDINRPWLLDQFKNVVNKDCGLQRSKFETQADQQEAVYRYKAEEALAWNEGSDENDFPFLMEESEARNMLIPEVVEIILQKRNEIKRVYAKLDGLRFIAHQNIENSTTILEMLEACKVNWQTAIEE